MILITGATGTNGIELVRVLAAGNHPARALVRDPQRAAERLPAHVELARGDFDDADSLVEAMDGVERLFLLSPVDPRLVELEGRAIDAAKRAGVARVVKLSAAGADAGAAAFFPRAHGQAEAHLKASGLAWTVLRPTFFMQNLLGMAAAIKAGTIYQPGGEGKAAHVDVRDIAAVAAAALTEDGHAGKTYEITGPQDLGYSEIAATLSAATGRAVRYADVPRDAAKQSMTGGGMPEWLAEALCELMDLLRAGKMAGVTGDVEAVSGRPARSFEQFARDHADTFR